MSQIWLMPFFMDFFQYTDRKYITELAGRKYGSRWKEIFLEIVQIMIKLVYLEIKLITIWEYLYLPRYHFQFFLDFFNVLTEFQDSGIKYRIPQDCLFGDKRAKKLSLWYINVLTEFQDSGIKYRIPQDCLFGDKRAKKLSLWYMRVKKMFPNFYKIHYI